MLFEKSDHFNELIKYHEKSIDELALSLENLEGNTLSRTVLAEWKAGINETIAKFGFELETCGNDFKTTDNFVEKYMPIRIQSMISSCLKPILKPFQLTLLQEYESKLVSFVQFVYKISFLYSKNLRKVVPSSFKRFWCS